MPAVCWQVVQDASVAPSATRRDEVCDGCAVLPRPVSSPPPAQHTHTRAGLIFILLDLLRLKDLATKLEDLWGGRVGVLLPTNPRETDPVVLFAHHRHSFWPLDPFRPLLKFFLNEGFPAHAHRGFQTVTYVMKVRASRRFPPPQDISSFTGIARPGACSVRPGVVKYETRGGVKAPSPREGLTMPSPLRGPRGRPR